MAVAKKRPAEGLAADAKPTFLERFHAWWEGYDLTAPARRIPRPVIPEENPVDEELSEWPTEYKDIVQLIWGAGFDKPGGRDFAVDLVKTFGLTPATTALEIGAGPGGTARAVAEEFGTYVTACEVNPELAKEAANLALVYNLDDKINVHSLDLDDIQFRKDFYQGVVIRDVLHLIQDKDEFLGEVADSVKQGCQIVITDLMDASGGGEWADAEPEPIYLCDATEMTERLTNLNLSVRKMEDQTEFYHSMILRSLGGAGATYGGSAATAKPAGPHGGGGGALGPPGCCDRIGTAPLLLDHDDPALMRFPAPGRLTAPATAGMVRRL